MENEAVVMEHVINMGLPEYMEVTATYTLSDFEQITAQEKAKGGSK